MVVLGSDDIAVEWFRGKLGQYRLSGEQTECGDITISSNGPTANKSSDNLGVYRKTFLAVAPSKAAWVVRLVRDKLHFTSASIAGAELILGDLLHRIFFKNFFKGIPIPYTPIMLCKISKIS